MLRKLTLILCLLIAAAGQAQISDYIHIDQFGYQPAASKVAVISDPQVGYNAGDSYTVGSSLEVVRINDDEVVFTGPPMLWNGGATHTHSGDRGWWFDFSSVGTPGTYRIEDPSSGAYSADFEIAESVYADVLTAATRMFYYNRCNAEKLAIHAGANWSDATSFLNPGQDADCRYIGAIGNASLTKDMSGGWFDAGDYNKYVTFSESTLQNLLWAYQESPQVFGDDTGIPESGNGIPDVLDEIKWELDWLMRMCNANGSTHIKVGSTNTSINEASPPSVNTGPRYYGPTCTSASLTIASVLSHAASVFGEIASMSAYAESLRAEAESAWSYVYPMILSNSLEVNCDDGSIVVGDTDSNVEEQMDMALTAAIYLWALTGLDNYHDYVLANFQDAEQLQGGFLGVNRIPLTDALLYYAQLPSADIDAANAIHESIITIVSNNWNGIFGFNEADLYRGFMNDWNYNWGSNMARAAYGNLNRSIVNLGVMSASQGSFMQESEEMLHCLHGVNPLGLVYLSNMYELGAERCVNEMYHSWFADGTDYDHALNSPLGPAPGFLVGGPNPFFTQSQIVPPAGQPAQKSYLDFNTSWPDNSWEISEPAIYYQAAYIRLLASSVSISAPCPEDLDHDGVVDIDDFLLFNSAFGDICMNCPEDFDGDGEVGVSDFLFFNSAFGTICD